MTKSLIIYEDLLWIFTKIVVMRYIKKMLRFTPRSGGLGGALRARPPSSLRGSAPGATRASATPPCLRHAPWYYLLSAWVVRTRFLLTPTSAAGILVFSLGTAVRQRVTADNGLVRAAFTVQKNTAATRPLTASLPCPLLRCLLLGTDCGPSAPCQYQ